MKPFHAVIRDFRSDVAKPGFRQKATAIVAAAPPKIVVWHTDEPAWMVRRTLRRLRDWGLSVSASPLALLGDSISDERIVWLLRAGTLPPGPAMLRLGRDSPHILIGPPLDDTGLPQGRWREVFERRAGRLDEDADPPPEPAIVAVGEPRALAEHLRSAPGLMAAILRCGGTHSLVPASGLGASRDLNPRVAICISSLHVGGAEKVAADLSRLLPRERITTRLFVLDRPQREALDAGPGAFLCYDGTAPGEARLRRLTSALSAWGADALSLHLLSSNPLRALATPDRPCLLTLHNDREGWPASYEDVARRMRLVIGCSVGVSRQARAAGLHPVRTAWNGVTDHRPEAPHARTPLTRQDMGIAPGALVVLSVANDRPQKRLDRVEPIIACPLNLPPTMSIVVGGLAGFIFPAMQSLMTKAIPEDAQGELQGALASSFCVAAIIGPIVMSHLFSAFTSGAGTHFPGAPFVAGAVLVLCAAGVLFQWGRQGRRTPGAL